MRAFFVGLTFLAAVVILIGIWFLLFPLLLLMGLLLRFMLVCLFAIIGIWLLGKLIIFIWGKLKLNSPDSLGIPASRQENDKTQNSK